MLPARQGAHSSNGSLHDTVEAVGECVPKDGALHVCGFDLLAGGEDGSRIRDDRLGDVEAVVDVLGEAEDDDDVVFVGGFADLSHFGG